MSCHVMNVICFRASPTPKRGGVFPLHARHVAPKNHWPCFPDESLAANTPHKVATPPNSPMQETNLGDYDKCLEIGRNESSEGSDRAGRDVLLPRPYHVPCRSRTMLDYEKRIVRCENKINFLLKHRHKCEDVKKGFFFSFGKDFNPMRHCH